MDYYRVLKVPSSAKQIDLDRAYQKLCKEARYDTSINRKDVEVAYRTLSDATQRALYDAAVAEYNKTSQTAKIRQKKKSSEDRQKTLKIAMVALLIIASCYYVYYFRSSFKSFEPGDRLYYIYNDKPAGVIMKVDPDYSFGKFRSKAYQVKDGDKLFWVRARNVASNCYAK